MMPLAKMPANQLGMRNEQNWYISSQTEAIRKVPKMSTRTSRKNASKNIFSLLLYLDEVLIMLGYFFQIPEAKLLLILIYACVCVIFHQYLPIAVSQA